MMGKKDGQMQIMIVDMGRVNNFVFSFLSWQRI